MMEDAALSFRHLIDFGDLTRQEWEELYGRCAQIMDNPAAFMESCKGKVQANLFFEPSTRTNFSFQTAMLRLGGQVFGFADPKSSSAAKGESLKDTIKMVSAYADVIVMRNPKEGAAKAASIYSEVPVINAGDGGHMHPTQTLADLTTIQRYRGSIDNLSIGLCGDLKNGRTVHSLIKALAKFDNIRFYLIAPRELAIPEYMRSFMREHKMKFVEVTGLEATIPMLDVLYMTRIQQERFSNPVEYEKVKGVYVLTRKKLERAKKDMMVLHPLPRVDEIAVDVDDDPRALYFEQARCGMYARMALLMDLASQPHKLPEPVEIGTEPLCHNPNCITQSEKYLPPLTKTVGGVRCCAYCDKELD
jgi:aspartate carbamoyltransferase catalytic subunit